MPATYTPGVSPPSGLTGRAPTFSVTPDVPLTGTITAAYSGGGLPPGTATSSHVNSGGTSSSTPVPLQVGTVTPAATNDAGPTDPPPATYPVTSLPPTVRLLRPGRRRP